LSYDRRASGKIPPRQAFWTVSTTVFGTEHRIDIAHDLIEEVCLHRQHDDILLAGIGRLVDGLHSGGLDLPSCHSSLRPFFGSLRDARPGR